MRAQDALNAIESVAGRVPVEEKAVLILKLEFLRQHRLESDEKAAYWMKRVEQLDKDMAKLNQALEALG